MSNLLFIDSAFPLARYPAADGIAFYIGGDTPHTWSKAEINAAPYKYRLPVYVRSNPPGPGAATDVTACVSRLNAIGAPEGTLVAWDMETAADPAYISAVYGLLLAAGWKLIVYASQSFVSGQGNPDGLYWGADWTSVLHLKSPDVMTQYVNLGGYDESAAQASLPFWDTAGGPVTPPPAPVPWPLAEGSTDAADVTILQRGLNKWKYASPLLATDGVFGPLTLAAVKAAQAALKMTVTGIADRALWAALLVNPGPVPPVLKTITGVQVSYSDGTLIRFP